MSDNRVKTDDKYFIQKFKHELKSVIASMSGMHQLARDRGITGKDHILFNLFQELGKASKSYIGYKYHHLDNTIQLRDAFKEKKTMSAMDRKKLESKNLFNSAISSKINNRNSWNVEVNTTVQGCGVVYDGSAIKKFVIPMMYSNHANEIGSLGSNKVLVYATPHKHDVYKCWKASYFTFKYSNGVKKYEEVKCYIMKDKNSSIVYYHTDYKLCASGMRRAIGRHIAKRIGG